MTSWKTMRVLGGRSAGVRGAPPVALLAVSGSRLALVPADRSTAICKHWESCPRELPTALPRFEIRSVGGGGVLARHSLDGAPTAIALSDRFAAVLVRGKNAARIALYDARTGAARGRRAIPVATADELAISGWRIVYGVARQIHVFDAARGVDRVVAVARSTPVGLALEGRRVAWGRERRRARSHRVGAPACLAPVHRAPR